MRTHLHCNLGAFFLAAADSRRPFRDRFERFPAAGPLRFELKELGSALLVAAHSAQLSGTVR